MAALCALDALLLLLLLLLLCLPHAKAIGYSTIFLLQYPSSTAGFFNFST
jgi:hypothetical protein